MAMNFQVQREGWHYTIVENAVLEDKALPSDAKLVYVYLSKYACNKGECWPAIGTLAGSIGISERQVYRMLKELENRGYIKKENRKTENGQLSNLYILKYIRPTDRQSPPPDRVAVPPLTGSQPPPDRVADERDPLKEKHINNIYTSEFLTFWECYPRQIEKKKAFRCWNARLKEKVPAEDMITSAKNYAIYCKNNKVEMRYRKHPSTFLGPDKHYEEFISGPPEPDPTDPDDGLTPSQRHLKALRESMIDL